MTVTDKLINQGAPYEINGEDHTGALYVLPNREHRAKCACGWRGPAYYGKGTASREHDDHLREVRGD